MRKYLLLVFFFIQLSCNIFAQDPEFTQFYANPIYLNPAFAGTSFGPRFILNYRNQWPSIPAAFVTYAASWDQHFDALSGGLGLQVMYDRAGEGEYSTLDGKLMYAYHLRVSDNFALRAGIEAGLMTKRIDFDKLRFGDQINPKLGFIYPSAEKYAMTGVHSIGPVPDFAAGIMGYTKKFYAGFAYHHLSKPQISFYEDNKSVLYPKITAHVGLMLPLDNNRVPKNYLSPNILFQMQDKFTQFNVGLYYIKDFFISGIWFRQTSENFDALMVLIGIKKDPIKIGYSYDITFSDARFGAKGSHEVSLIIELKTNKRQPSTKWRKLICPSF
jgi:type IX secretion system PorP/SprF family membrane protein